MQRDDALELRNRGHEGCSADAVLTAMRDPSGAIFLICDECESCFTHPDRAWALDGPDFEGTMERRARDAEYATVDDVRAVGWEPRWFFGRNDVR